MTANERGVVSRPPGAAFALVNLGVRRSWWAALLLVALASSAPGAAQDREEFQQWSAVLATASVQPAPPGLFFWVDLHARRGDPGTVVLVRPGVGVEITPWLNVLAGYVWIPTFVDATGDSSHEHRVWEQVVLKHRFDELGIFVQTRTRFEQRFSENDDAVALRLREFVRVNWHPSPAFPVGVALWDELFVGLTEQPWAPQGLDQNRIFLGPFLQMTPWARLEAGYLFVYLDRGPSDLFAHVLAVNLFLSPRPPAPAALPEQ